MKAVLLDTVRNFKSDIHTPLQRLDEYAFAWKTPEARGNLPDPAQVHPCLHPRS